MKELQEFVKSLKSKGSKRNFDPHLPARAWSEDDLVLGRKSRAFVIVLRTGGCRWSKVSGCTMCGYFNESLSRDATKEELLSQLKNALSKYNGEECIKIFTSGSFLDSIEVPEEAQIEIIERLAKKETVKKISVESRPEFVKSDRIRKLREIAKSKVFEIGIGLESANDHVLECCINKGFRFEDYKRAVSILREEDAKIKTYVLIKPPFLKEFEAIKDSIETVKKIRELTDAISFNPVSVHKNTLVEYLWRNGEYRPPWLWSVVEVLKKSKEIAGNLEIKCDVTGRGGKRGAHNCSKCSNKVLDAIARFSIEQDVNIFDGLNCECREMWKELLDLEPFSYSQLVVDYGNRKR